MSASDATETLGDLPEFELSYLYDDTDDPTEVTVFPGEDESELPTQWLSMDIGHAVAIENVR